MKKTLYILLAAAAMWSCSSVDEPAPVGGEGLRVSVSDNGFNSGSRTSDDGLVTTFTEGDLVAVYQVYEGKINYSSLYKAAIGESGEVSWISQTNSVISNLIGAKYYACYPGDKVDASKLNPAATDADGFFAQAVKDWKVLDDQSFPEDYSASDLMYAEGSINGEELSFGMTHAMALVSVKLPTRKYVFTNEPKIPDYVLGQPSEVSFTGMIPRFDENLGYLWLVNPADGESVEVSGEYNNGSEMRQWSATAHPKAGKISNFNIDPSENLTVSHKLQIGDFFLSDGGLLSKDATQEEINNSYIVGVVYNIDPSRIGDTEKAQLNGVVHGSVFAIRDIYDPYDLLMWSDKQLDEKEIGFPDIIGEDLAGSFTLADADFSGLDYLMKLKAKRPDEYANNKYEAFKFAEAFGSDMPNIDKLRAATTGWYLPALGQWFDIVRNLCGVNLTSAGMQGAPDVFGWGNQGRLTDKLNKWTEKVLDTQKTVAPSNRYYWTASVSQPLYAYYLNVSNGDAGVLTFFCTANRKTSITYARAVLTF